MKFIIVTTQYDNNKHILLYDSLICVNINVTPTVTRDTYDINNTQNILLPQSSYNKLASLVIDTIASVIPREILIDKNENSIIVFMLIHIFVHRTK
jgi:hypothetical protein